MTAPMSDSKGAAIDEVIEQELVQTFKLGMLDGAALGKSPDPIPALKERQRNIKTAILAILAQEVNTDAVTRFEVIDHRTRLGGGVAGRVLVIDPRSPQELPAKVELSLQDDGRTLKVFVSDRKAGLV